MADGKEAASQEPTDIVVEDELAKDTDLGTNSQSVSLQRSQSMPSMVSLHQGQLKAKMRLRAELKGCRGPKVRMRKTLQSSWDERHHLNGSENEAKPKMLRDYFSKPESLPELKQTLTQMPNVKDVLFVGGAVGVEVAEKLRARLCLGEGGVRQSYGQQETLQSVTRTSTRQVNLASAGMLLPNCEVRIVREDGSYCLEPEESGEILVRARHMMLRYCSDEERTQQTLIPENWLRTGDVGYFDEAGGLHVTHRLPEGVNTASKTVINASEEEGLQKLPEARNSAPCSTTGGA
eukprot:TRINITY_DN11870_c0_g1_i7.p1 TRINITY_DN11870_c0_g1~~TRINITY_DN11870_c0_g1_i7.p1  ORF type:complete len:292 (+),score=50.06 TRINITY_DN11870_c0_g1_i7:149-1024(+)